MIKKILNKVANTLTPTNQLDTKLTRTVSSIEQEYINRLEKAVMSQNSTPFIKRNPEPSYPRDASPENQTIEIASVDEKENINNFQQPETTPVYTNDNVNKEKVRHDIDCENVAPGTILKLEDNTIAVFAEEIADKEYDLIYVPERNGRLTPKGLVLCAYDIQELGRIPDHILAKMKKTLMWSKEVLVFHLHEYEYIKYIPDIIPEEGVSENNNQIYEQNSNGSSLEKILKEAESSKELIRGREFKIKISDKEWSAVYWGKDQMGTIVAHKTVKNWSLMHLDLERFQDSIVLGNVIDDAVMREIEKSLLQKYL